MRGAPVEALFVGGQVGMLLVGDNGAEAVVKQLHHAVARKPNIVRLTEEEEQEKQKRQD